MSNGLAELISDIKEQILFMQELGVDSLDAQLPQLAAQESVARRNVQEPKFVPPDIPLAVPQPKPVERPGDVGSRLSTLPSLKKRTSTPPKTVIPANVQGEINMPEAKTEKTQDAALFDVSPALPESGETIEDIRADVGNCTRCELWEGRTRIVHTTGNSNADLMFIGEAPGADEDAQGEPFVGRAGQLLNKIIESIGMRRVDVCIGNINRCRPPGNRKPTIQEAHTCRPFLIREIAVIKPKVIVVLGNTAFHNLMDTKVGITQARGIFHDYFGVKVMPTFHPAFLLRDPHKKREVWEDMKKVRDYLAQTK
jgi:uracil-DNA glycosylase family 4